MRTWLSTTLALGFGLGCVEDEPAEIVGTVYDGRGDGAQPLVGAQVSVVNPARGDVIGTAVTDAEGIFRSVLSRGGDGVAIEVRADGFVTTVLHGNAPNTGVLAVPDRALYALSDAAHASLEARWAGCPELDEGGFVFGEVRVFDLVDPITGESPTTSEGQIEVVGLDDSGKVDVTWTACYLTDDGTRYDETAEFTGDSGQFAIFGVGPGYHELRVQWQYAPNAWNLSVYPAWVPEGERVALPLWPAWVELEIKL